MPETTFFVVAVLVGMIVLAAVLWNYVKNVAQKNPTLTITLSFIGFVLVASPLWANIVIRGPNVELRLLRETTKTQAEAYLKLIGRTLPSEKAAEIKPEINSIQGSFENLKETEDTEKRATSYKIIRDSTRSISEKL